MSRLHHTEHRECLTGGANISSVCLVFVVLGRAGKCPLPPSLPPITRSHTHTHTHESVPPLPSNQSFPPVTCYLAFPRLRRPAPHETLINDPQVLLPVVHLEAADMGAARGTHGSHSIRGRSCSGGKPLQLKPWPSPQSQRSDRGWLGLARLPGFVIRR